MNKISALAIATMIAACTVPAFASPAKLASAPAIKTAAPMSIKKTSKLSRKAPQKVVLTKVKHAK